MKKLILMMMLLAGLNVFTQAQTKTKKTPEQKAQHMTKMLQKKLALTADQSAKVNTILLKRATQMDSLKNNQATHDHKLTKLSRRKIMLGTDEQLKNVLTADQQKTYAEIKASHKEKARAKTSAPAPAVAPAPSAG